LLLRSGNSCGTTGTIARKRIAAESISGRSNGILAGLLSTYSTHRVLVIDFASLLVTVGFILCIIWWYANAIDNPFYIIDM
jgi:hypothetical protein